MWTAYSSTSFILKWCLTFWVAPTCGFKRWAWTSLEDESRIEENFQTHEKTCCLICSQDAVVCRGFFASIIGVLGCTTWIHLSICGFRLWNHLQVAYCTAKLLAASHWVGWLLRWPLVWFLVSPLPRWPMGFMQGRQLELGFFPVHSTRVTRSIPSIPILKQTHGQSPFIFSLRKCFQLNFSRLTQHMHLTCV